MPRYKACKGESRIKRERERDWRHTEIERDRRQREREMKEGIKRGRLKC